MPAGVIRSRRQALGLTQSELAAAVGVDPRTVSRWEAGHARPTNSHLLRLSALLGVPPDVLL